VFTQSIPEARHMPNNLVFFAVHADDLRRARRFYEKVFQWKFQPWGPPDFFLIDTGSQNGTGVQGALQKRHELVPGQRMIGYECSIEVADIDATAKAVAANGGTIVVPQCEIPTVGWIIKFRDPEGNLVGAKQPSAAPLE
jgi:predicted enzyme related to lactoylglutathione lyase